METAEVILSKVKQFFNDLVAPAPIMAPDPAPAPVALNEYDLKDGGKVTIDKVEVGGIVMIDGSAALPGELELMDGTKLTVTDNGMIEVVTPGEAVAVVEPVEPVVDEMGAKFASFETMTNEKFANYETKFSAYEQRFADYEVKMSKANKVIEELLKLSTLIVEAPIVPGDPAQRPVNNFNEQTEAEKEKQKKYGILFN